MKQTPRDRVKTAKKKACKTFRREGPGRVSFPSSEGLKHLKVFKDLKAYG